VEIMLDITLIRENSELVRADLKKRGDNEKMKWVNLVKQLDEDWRRKLGELEKLRHKKNVVTKEIGTSSAEMRKKKIDDVKNINDRISELENDVVEIDRERRDYLMNLPNILHKSVPVGKDDSENVVVRKWGIPKKFSFDAKDHIDITAGLGIMDVERAVKVSGSGFLMLKGDLVILDYSIMRFALDFMVKQGFTAIEPPYMMNRKSYEGVASLSDFEDVMYKVDGEDLYLIATSEHPMGAMHAGEVIPEEDLPLKYTGISPCFRKEVGSHGKYSRGLFRTHQFNKVEQFIFSDQESSWKLHEELQKNSEKLYKLLKIPFRVVSVCTGDIGNIAAKKYDIEAWLPSIKEYKEVGSNSNCTDYQARRLNIKYGKHGGKKEYVHTLNNTAIATSRTMLAMIENNQMKNGSFKIPSALWKYTGFKKIEASK
jgi:seryl-tRNA synthetase